MVSKTHTMLLRCQTIGRGGARRILEAAKHNLREIGGAHIDANKNRLNVILAGPPVAADVASLAAAKTAEAVAAGGASVARKVTRKGGTLAAEFIFGLPGSTTVDTAAYFAACLGWVINTFGDVVLSAVIHYDESNPHAHVLMLPMRHGEWLASDVFGKKADIQQLQNDFARRVGRRFGVKRAPPRLSGADKVGAAAAVIQHLKNSEAAVLRCETWPVVRDLIHADPRPFAEQLGIQLKVTVRTLAQLKVSAGRGAKRESTPIGDLPADLAIPYPVLDDLDLAPRSALAVSESTEPGGRPWAE